MEKNKVLFFFSFQMLLAILGYAESPDQASIKQAGDSTQPSWKTRLQAEGLLKGKNMISGDLSYLSGRLQDFEKLNSGGLDYSKPIYKLRSTVCFSLRAALYKKLSLNVILLHNLNDNHLNAPWLRSDFYYSLERVNYAPNTFSYGYYNYELNRFDQDFHTLGESFLRGFYYLSYRHVPTRLVNKIRWSRSANIILTYSVRYAYKYLDPKGNLTDQFLMHKPMLGGTARIVLVGNIYVEAGAAYYVKPGSKLDWDPDYSYGFGYSNWKPFTLSLIYYNGLFNRFPWNAKAAPPDYGFADGIVRLSLSYKL